MCCTIFVALCCTIFVALYCTIFVALYYTICVFSCLLSCFYSSEWSTDGLTVYEVSLVRTNPAGCGPPLVSLVSLGGCGPPPPLANPRYPLPSLNVGGAHMVDSGHTHLCPDVALTLAVEGGYHSPCGRASRYTPHTPKTVSGHTSRVSCQGCHPPPSPPRTQQPPTLTPHITSPHPSSERLEKWEMFSQQPSHYHRSHPSS